MPATKRIQRMKRIMCQKGLAMIRPYSRRRESAYILSYQSLFSVSINRASPEGDFPKCAKEGLAQAPSRGGFQKRYIKPDFCQPQLADCLATLLFPYREVGIELPTTLKRWQNPGKPGTKWRTVMPMVITLRLMSNRRCPVQLKVPPDQKVLGREAERYFRECRQSYSKGWPWHHWRRKDAANH